MTIPEPAPPPPARGRGLLVEFPQEELIAKWEEFFEEAGYQSKIISVTDRYPEERSLEVPFDELNRFDTDMAIYLLRHPLNVLTAGEEAIRRIAPPGEEALQIHLRIKALPRDRRVAIRDLRAKHLGQYIAAEGLVRKATEVRPRVTDALFQCLRCGTIIKEPQDGQAFREPLECYEEQGGCKRSANATKFKLLTETSMYLDTQKLEIQEAPEGLRGGEEPQRLTLYLEDDLTGRITPGERVVMNGILRSVQKGRPGAKSTLFDIFLDVNSVEKEQVEFEEIEVTEEDARLIREAGSSPDIFRLINASIAPSLYGMHVEKEALALQLFSGVPKVMPDGRRIRGDLHVLMVGDPGTGKSELLSYMSRLSPRGIYATGKAATAAGLCVAGESLIATDLGVREIEDFALQHFPGEERRWQLEEATASGKIVTFDEQNRLALRDVGAVWRLDPPPVLLEITTRSGRSLSVTPATKLLVDHAMGQSWIPARYLQKGMRIATASRLEYPEAEPPLLIDLLGGVSTRITVDVDSAFMARLVESLRRKFGSLREAATRLLLPEDLLYHGWRADRRAINLSQLLAAAETVGIPRADVAAALRSYSQTGGQQISLPVRLDEDVAYFAGLIAGNGGIERGNLGGLSIRFSNSNRALIESYKGLVGRMFSVVPDFTPQSPLRAATIRFHSTLIATILHRLGIPRSPKSGLSLPRLLLNAPRPLLAAYLRGFFDAGGAVHSRKRGEISISITTTSRVLADRIQLALLRFGILALRRTRQIQGRRAVRFDGRTTIGRHNQYVLEIRDWTSQSRFRDDIGFRHPEKAEKLRTLMARSAPSNANPVGSEGLQLREIRRLLGLGPRQAYPSREGGGRAYERGSIAAAHDRLMEYIDSLQAAFQADRWEGIRIRLSQGLKEQLHRVLQSHGIAPRDLAKAVVISVDRAIEYFYRISRAKAEIPVRVIQRLEDHLSAFDPVTAGELDAAIRPWLRRIAKIPGRLQFLRVLASGDVRWEPVADVRVLRTEDRRSVYDLTVREAHAFVANGILVHNTAAAVRDEFGEGRWTLEAGALVLADLGLACIDEIEKMNPQDRAAIHEAMEQQRISVAKAGITAVLQSRCAVLAAANPKFGRFDEHKYISEQIDLPPALLSRFDVIFSMIDRPQAERDREMAEHILRGHRVGEILRRRETGAATEEPEPLERPFTPHFSPEFLRKYVAYAKRIYPVMTDEAMAIIEKKYLEIRRTGEAAGSSVPITPRQLEAIVRLSEAGARLRLSETVAAEDADRAVRIVEYWMGKVAGEEGRFDIDIIQTGISQSQREQIISLRDIISELAGPEGVADYEDIVRVAQERGIPPAKVDAWLKRWAQEGEIYSPAKNKYKLVERL